MLSRADTSDRGGSCVRVCNQIMAFSVLTQKMSVVAPGAPALRARLPARPGAQRANPTICSAAKRPEAEPFLASKLAVPFAGALAAAMLLGAVLPEDALAARRARRVLLCSGCCVARAELDLVPFQAGMCVAHRGQLLSCLRQRRCYGLRPVWGR
jgi:hypothetical protein